MTTYKLRNNEEVLIRESQITDAEALIKLMKQADTESLFLAREPGEFKLTVEQEQGFIQNTLNDPDHCMLVAEYHGEIIGLCSIGLVRKNLRYRHRASVAFLLIKKYWNLGIGGKMMEECISWAKSHNIEKLELDVVSTNEKAIQMYEAFGFAKTGTIHNSLKYADGAYADEYYMEMCL